LVDRRRLPPVEPQAEEKSSSGPVTCRKDHHERGCGAAPNAPELLTARDAAAGWRRAGAAPTRPCPAGRTEPTGAGAGQGRGKVVRQAADLGRCHGEEAAARRPAPSSRRWTNRRVALTWAGGEHPSCRSEPQRFLQRLGEGAGQDRRRSHPTNLTLPRPWVVVGPPGLVQSRHTGA
jgi:hypothetical protein